MALASQCLCGNARLQAVSMNNPAMFAGETGFAVALVQQALSDLGYFFPISMSGAGVPDGVFGDETFARIKDFQGVVGLKDDGIVGALTIGAVDGILARDEKKDHQWFKLEIRGLPAPKELPEDVVWNADAYREAVYRVIEHRMMTTEVFKAVIAAISGKVLVRPSKNARTSGARWVGSEDTLYYTPGNFSPGSRLYTANKYYIAHGADEVLLHELVHAMRTKAGFQVEDQVELKAIQHPPSTTGKKANDFLAFGTRGEFNAIVIANTYMSEKEPDRPIHGLHRNTLMLRMDHHEPNSILPLRSPETFHETPEIKDLLLQLWKEQPAFCKQVAAVKGQFNPIRDVR